MSVVFHPLKVKKVKKETPDCVSVSFDVPAEVPFILPEDIMVLPLTTVYFNASLFFNLSPIEVTSIYMCPYMSYVLSFLYNVMVMLFPPVYVDDGFMVPRVISVPLLYVI